MAEMVEIDQRGRLTLPRELRSEGKGRAFIISAGTFLVLIPISNKPAEVAMDWLKSDRETVQLRKLAEMKARDEAVSRAKRKSRFDA